MRLAVQTSGSGPRLAILVHGMMSDHHAWNNVAADLESDGFRVVTVDLAGHGASPRSRRYSPRLWADDVIETLEPVLHGETPDLMVGHSLGALVVSLVAERFPPRAAIYVDPAFAFPRGIRGVIVKAVFTLGPRPGVGLLRRMNPRWSATDLAVEAASAQTWDRRTILGFVNTRPLAPPRMLVAPSLVILAEKSLLISSAEAGRLRERGMTVSSIPGSGHTVFRDDHGEFMRLARDWVSLHLAPVASD